MSNRIIDLGYTPRHQFVPFHKRKERWACLVVHRRGGKTVACVMDLVDSALRCRKPNPRFAYIAPLYAQAKDVAWSYLKDYVSNIPGVDTNESELRVELPTGGRIRLYGADNYDRMRGIYLDGAVLDEYGDMDPRAYPEVIRPALSDRKGWATFIGTPKGRNAFYELMHGSETWEGAVNSPDWYSLTLRASESGLIDDAELADARSMMSEDQFEQEYECSFDAALVGAYFGKLMVEAEKDGRICSVPYDPTLPVYTSWDLGVDDATAVWFAQVAGREVRLIDYFETHDGLIEAAKTLLNDKPYTYAEHYFPHDGDTKEITSNLTRKDTLESLGLNPIAVGARVGPEERIHASRGMIPKCVFDARKCRHGVDVLKQYQREWDDKLKTFRRNPKHDWASHGADAFGELALALVPPQKPRERRRARLGTIA